MKFQAYNYEKYFTIEEIQEVFNRQWSSYENEKAFLDLDVMKVYPKNYEEPEWFDGKEAVTNKGEVVLTVDSDFYLAPTNKNIAIMKRKFLFLTCAIQTLLDRKGVEKLISQKQKRLHFLKKLLQTQIKIDLYISYANKDHHLFGLNGNVKLKNLDDLNELCNRYNIKLHLINGVYYSDLISTNKNFYLTIENEKPEIYIIYDLQKEMQNLEAKISELQDFLERTA